MRRVAACACVPVPVPVPEADIPSWPRFGRERLERAGAAPGGLEGARGGTEALGETVGVIDVSCPDPGGRLGVWAGPCRTLTATRQGARGGRSVRGGTVRDPLRGLGNRAPPGGPARKVGAYASLAAATPESLRGRRQIRHPVSAASPLQRPSIVRRAMGVGVRRIWPGKRRKKRQR